MSTEARSRTYALPLVQPRDPIRQTLKPLAGSLACALMPDRARAIEAGTGPERLGFVDRLMMSALLRRALRGDSAEEFIHRQHQQFWSSAEAANFHSDHEHYFEQWFLGENVALMEQLRLVIASGQFSTLCEIGCGSGKLLDWSRRHLSGLRQFIGLDLSREQIARNRRRYADPALQWITGDAAEWVDSFARPGSIFLSNNGVLEYFREGSLRRMFRKIGQELRPAGVCLIEPIGQRHDLKARPASELYGTERSFSHNYPQMLQEAGFELLHQSELNTAEHRLLRIVARAG